MDLRFIEGPNNPPFLEWEDWRLTLRDGKYFQVQKDGLSINSRMELDKEIEDKNPSEETRIDLIIFCHLVSAFRLDKDFLIHLLEDEEETKKLVYFVNKSLNYYKLTDRYFDECLFDVPPDLEGPDKNDYFRNVLEAYNARYVITKEGFTLLNTPEFKYEVELLEADYEKARKLFLSPAMKQIGIQFDNYTWIKSILEDNNFITTSEDADYNLVHSGDYGEYSSLYFEMTFEKEKENLSLLNNLESYGRITRCDGQINLEGLFTGVFKSIGVLESDKWDYECKVIDNRLNVNGRFVEENVVTVFVYSYDDDPKNGFDFLIVNNFKDDKSISIISLTTEYDFRDTDEEDKCRAKLVELLEKSFDSKISAKY